MLTERQQKFYSEISNLLITNINMSDKERKRLQTAKQALDSGCNFRDVIHTLMVDLRYIQAAAQIKYALTQGGLSPDVQKLYDQLVKSYGKPVDEYAQKLMAVAGDRQNIDNSGKPSHEALTASPFSVVNFLSWLLLSLILMLTMFAFNWLISTLTVIGTILFYVIGLLLVVLGLIKNRIF